MTATSKGGLEYNLIIPKGKTTVDAVIYLHGWQSDSIRSKRGKTFAKYATKKGLAVFLLNMPGHGKSKGQITDFTVKKGASAVLKFIREMEKKYPEVTIISILGGSIGGSVALIAASKLKKINTLVTLAPRTDFSDTTPETYTINNSERINFAIRKEGLGMNFKKIVVSITAKTLIMHGKSDEVVSCSQSEKIFPYLFTNKKLIIYRNCDHKFSGKFFDKSLLTAVKWITAKNI